MYKLNKSIFISCERVDDDYPSKLIAYLKAKGYTVRHSPKNPVDGKDDKWENWYSFGLNDCLENSNYFIIIVTDSWDSSSWMGQEAASGKLLYNNKVISKYMYIDLRSNINIPLGMATFLENKIPKEFVAVCEAICQI